MPCIFLFTANVREESIGFPEIIKITKIFTFVQIFANVVQPFSFSRKSPDAFCFREKIQLLAKTENFSTYLAHGVLFYTYFRESFRGNKYSRENLPKSHFIKILHKNGTFVAFCLFSKKLKEK